MELEWRPVTTSRRVGRDCPVRTGYRIMSWLHFSGYRPHLLYSLAITSLSIHLIYHRKFSEGQRAQINAQISILQDISQQLRSNKVLSKDELERLRNLARPSEAAFEDITAGTMTWKEALLGKKQKQDDDKSWKSVHMIYLGARPSFYQLRCSKIAVLSLNDPSVPRAAEVSRLRPVLRFIRLQEKRTCAPRCLGVLPLVVPNSGLE